MWQGLPSALWCALPMSQVPRAPIQLAVPIGGKPDDRALAGHPNTPGRLWRSLRAVPGKAEAHAAQDVHAAQGDADWVILSACNTAAGGTEGAEALSGMSRAFFYAGARALLVSHWAVNSDAAVKLITKTLSTMAPTRPLAARRHCAGRGWRS
jgi:CHAT domain